MTVSPLYADDEEGPAKNLANPITFLISVLFQCNYDTDYGPDDQSSKHFVNIQPVIPFAISADYNLISYYILPEIDADNVLPGKSKSGIGDLVQSFFFLEHPYFFTPDRQLSPITTSNMPKLRKLLLHNHATFITTSLESGRTGVFAVGKKAILPIIILFAIFLIERKK